MSEPHIQVGCQMRDGERAPPPETGVTPVLPSPHAGGWAVALQQHLRPSAPGAQVRVACPPLPEAAR